MYSSIPYSKYPSLFLKRNTLVHEKVLHLRIRIILLCSRYSMGKCNNSLWIQASCINSRLKSGTLTQHQHQKHKSLPLELGQQLWISSSFLTSECVGYWRIMHTLPGYFSQGKVKWSILFRYSPPFWAIRSYFSWPLCFHMKNIFNNISKHSKWLTLKINLS